MSQFQVSIIQMLSVLVISLLSFMLSAAEVSVVRVAVASNFSMTMKQLVREFEQDTGIRVSVSQASTGKLFAQIIHGAPYDIFFSADSKRPDLLIKKKLVSKEFVYAEGQLVMLEKKQDGIKCNTGFQISRFNKIAIANPKTAPYGLATKEVLIKLKKWQSLKSKLVMGENIMQTAQFLLSASVDAAFIAKSLIINTDNFNMYCQWVIPKDLYTAIKQKAVVLKSAENNIAAGLFFDYIQSVKARKIIRLNGYGVE